MVCVRISYVQHYVQTGYGIRYLLYSSLSLGVKICVEDLSNNLAATSISLRAKSSKKYSSTLNKIVPLLSPETKTNK
jgi:hypothetical protein